MDASALPRERVLWLDGVKCVAIIAVLLNHTQWVVYSSPWLMTFSTCCISLFILIAGMTSYLSDQRHARTWLQTFLLGSRRIFLAYLVTVFIYHAADASQHGQPMLFFDFEAYLAHLIRFDLPAPAYYVALYLQLMLVNRFLYRCIEGLPERGRLVWEIGGGVFLLLFAAYATNRTNILGIYGG